MTVADLVRIWKPKTRTDPELGPIWDRMLADQTAYEDSIRD